MHRRLASAVAVLTLLSACSSAESTSSASPSEASTPSPSAAVSVQASASAVVAACTPPELCGDVLAPGEYTAAVTTTEVTFSVGEGWRGTAYEELGFDLVRLDADVPQVMSAAPYSGVVYADVCSGAETEEIGTGAADFVAFIAERPGIEARGDATEVTIGGRPGWQVDVDAVDPGCESDPPERLWLWELEGVTDFHLNTGEAARLIALDGEEGVVVFIIEAFDPATFDTLLELTQPVLDSTTFG